MVLHAAAQKPPISPIQSAVEPVAAQLRSLTRLVADEWRFHAGDLPHGEEVALDDSQWTVVKNKTRAPKDAVWYRRWIVVPPTLNGYDLTGTKLWFQFSVYANGSVPEIIYFKAGA